MAGSLLIAAGENVVLQRLAQQLDGPGLSMFASANSLLWHARRFPPQVVVASANLPDIGGGDLVDILPILCPGVRIVLCGPDDPELARLLQASGGQFVPLTNTPDQNLRQLYQALNIEQPTTPLDEQAAQSLYPEPSWSGSAALSSRQMGSIQQILQRLLQETAADSLLFGDTVGMPLLRLGQMAGLRTDITGPLLAPAFYATGEFARQLADQTPQAMYLYEGARHNIYAFHVDQRYLLVLALEKANHPGAPAPVWALAKRAIRRMQQVLSV